MPMKVSTESTEVPGVLEVHAGIARDDRGFFTELYARGPWADAGIHETFVQDNLSLSSRGTMRGLHYQLRPHAMGKLVRALTGSIFDVAVDLRRGSPHFGKWVGRELSAENRVALWVPAGFAHGFLALEDNSLVLYKCTGEHVPEAERSLRYDDPAVGIAWPFQPTGVSPKDAQAPGLGDADHNFEYADATTADVSE